MNNRYLVNRGPTVIQMHADYLDSLYPLRYRSSLSVLNLYNRGYTFIGLIKALTTRISFAIHSPLAPPVILLYSFRIIKKLKRTVLYTARTVQENQAKVKR